MNAVQFLIENPFVTLSYDTQVAIKNLQRPTPKMPLTSQQNAKDKDAQKLKLPTKIYNDYEWICGCEVKNAFFCFPCLLYGGDQLWTKIGIDNVRRIRYYGEKHQISDAHLKNVLNLSFLGKPDITMKITSECNDKTIEQHNNEVTKNRKVLNAMIDSIKFGATLEHVLKEYDDSRILHNLVDFSCASDFSLREYLRTATIFKDSFKTIQNELLGIMLELYHEHVALELIKTSYIAIMLDETLDSSDRVQMVLLVRYILDDNVVERFWRFLNPQVRTGDVIYQTISDELASVITHSEKVIAQSYCGVTVLNEGPNQVPTRIRREFRLSNLIHYYAHTTYDIVSNVASTKVQCRIFFANINSLCRFFVTARVTQILQKALETKYWPSASPVSLRDEKWEVNTRFLNVINEYREVWIEALEKEVNDSKVHSRVFEGSVYVRILRDDNFVFWLSFFQKLFRPVDALIDQLHNSSVSCKINVDVEIWLKAILTIRSEIANRQDVNEIDDTDTVMKMEIVDHDLKEEVPDEVGKVVQLSPPPKRSKFSFDPGNNRDAIQVCGLLASEVKSRFDFMGYLAASYILSPEFFEKFHTSFPEADVQEVDKSYPYLDQKRLRNELKVLYGNVQLRQLNSRGCLSLLKVIQANGLADIFDETTRLLRIVLTTPSQTSETGRCFSKLKDVKTFLRNVSNVTLEEDKLNALAVLRCEKQFLGNIDSFNEKVIETFAVKNDHKNDFCFRSRSVKDKIVFF